MLIHCSQSKCVNPKMRRDKLRNGVYWQGVLKQKGIEQGIRVLINFQHSLVKQKAEQYIPRYTNSLILFGIRKKCLNSGRLLYGYKTDCSNYHCLSLLPTTHTHTHSVIQPSLKLQSVSMKLLEFIIVDFSVTDKLLIIHSIFIKHYSNNANKMGQCISYLQI